MGSDGTGKFFVVSDEKHRRVRPVLGFHAQVQCDQLRRNGAIREDDQLARSTGAAAKTTSPLAVFDFLKRTSIASLSEDAYRSFASHAERLARYEGLDGHANAVSIIRDKAFCSAGGTA